MSNENEEVEDVVVEEAQDDVTVEDNTPTLEDYNNLQKQLKTALAQKEHFKNKVQKKDEDLKTNNTQSGLTEDEIILYAQRHTKEEVALAKKLSAVNNTTLEEATKDEIFQAKLNTRLEKERSEKAQLRPSGSGRVYANKNIEDLSTDEHKDAYLKAIEDAGL